MCGSKSTVVSLFIKRFMTTIMLPILVYDGIVGLNIFRDNSIKQLFANMQVVAVTVASTNVEPGP